jgi:hypothetical protein
VLNDDAEQVSVPKATEIYLCNVCSTSRNSYPAPQHVTRGGSCRQQQLLLHLTDIYYTVAAPLPPHRRRRRLILMIP